MKKPLLFIVLFLLAFAFNSKNSNAQSIPNGGFESWTSATFDFPQFSIDNSNIEAFFKANAPFNCVKTTDNYHGTYAVQLTTVAGNGDTTFGYFVNGSPQGNAPWPGGIPYNQRPTGIHGYYKSSIASPDTGRIIVAFKKAGADLGVFTFPLYGTHNTYTPFQFTIPPMSQDPDTVIFGAVSSDAFNNFALVGSMLQLDSIAFTGVISQPADLNGDFELWQSQTINQPDSWYEQDRGNGVMRTTDSHSGTYAVELVTTVGDNNGNPVARGGNVSTGFYPNCPGSCPQLGGSPFTNQIDTLTFWYKYIPVGNDSAQANICFKKNGNMIWCTGGLFPASSNYTLGEVFFNIGQVPDTAIISFQSSSYQDSALSFVGSDLKVDDVQFKSQLGTQVPVVLFENAISIHPNPANDQVAITFPFTSGADLKIYNLFGQQVLQQQIAAGTSVLDISNLAQGVYMIRITNESLTNGIYDRKIIVAGK